MLAPQHQRVGGPAEADLLTKMLDHFLKTSRSTGNGSAQPPSRTARSCCGTRSRSVPDLFAGGLVTGGFAVNADQAEAIATAEIPLWVTHGVHDHLLNINLARDTRTALTNAYAAAACPAR
ncbi:hypothetical protein [Phytohabitans kaempferiae]|uniref:Phospholipase/carboxylesterase/thioesterase domain-containing protein n=1 Tax=Phytohabitans kaempferiae TaxID=1620943 RepID=A0ABV6M3V1_9ACTN